MGLVHHLDQEVIVAVKEEAEVVLPGKVLEAKKVVKKGSVKLKKTYKREGGGADNLLFIYRHPLFLLFSPLFSACSTVHTCPASIGSVLDSLD